MIIGVLLFVLKSSLVLGLALIITQRNWFSAALRHLVLLVALISIPLMYFLEGVSVVWLRIELPEFVQLWILEANNWLVSSGEMSAISTGALIVAKLKTYSPLLILVFSLGCLILSGYWFAQIFVTGKRVWDTHLLEGERITFPARFGRQIKLRQSCLHESPYTWGIFRPIVVVPMDWLFWSEEKRNSVLAHEQAHIRRFDTLTNIVSGLLVCLYWYNPLIWITHRRLLLLSEQACDDQVVNKEVIATEYASHLLEIVRSGNSKLAPAMSGKSSLYHRIHALLDSERSREQLNMSQLIFVLSISFMLTVPLGLVNAAALPYSLLPAHPLKNTSSDNRIGGSEDIEKLREPRPFKIRISNRYGEVDI